MKDMIMPKDDHLIYTLHCYTPDRFVFQRNNTRDTAFFDESCREDIMNMFDDIQHYALPHGVPLMITEFGAVAKRLPDTGEWNTEERRNFVKFFLSCAGSLGIPCLWWDNNYLGSGDEYFGLTDRTGLTCRFPEILQELTGSGRS